ncbi:family S53 protease [Dentipellis sp. KUC8613]|nr:family S53 protease [Dentipellis sp. KUC8613]
MRLLEKRDSAPHSFVSAGPAPSDHVLNLRIGLTQNNFPGLEKALYDVSTPGSSKYGKHLSKEEVAAFVAPASETVSYVQAWLKAHNLTSTPFSTAGDWLAVNATVEQANALLQAQFTKFTHADTGKQVVRTLSYSVPDNLHGLVQFVHPTTAFPTAMTSTRQSASTRRSVVDARSADAPVPDLCKIAVTPACLQQMYNIRRTLATQKSNTLAVTGYVNQFANQADLELFLELFRVDLDPSTNFTLVTLDGGENPQDLSEASSAADGDVQYTVGVASGVPVTFISVGEDIDETQGYLDTANYLLSLDNPPTVVNTDYGYGETDYPFSLGMALCSAYAQLGARGVSVIFPSGMEGVSGDQGTSCDNFSATFPSSCPYVTSVGGTYGIPPESAYGNSGGGFSSWFARPAYQADAVPPFLTVLGDTYKGRFNASGRAFPDISATARNHETVFRGQQIMTSGTGTSSTVVTSIVALLNDELIAAGKSPLGFLNPFLYAHPEAFTDITSGNNGGCFTDGFNAVEGWDPVTGLGTPDYVKLRTAAGLS